jgi:hypothetical protein
MRLSPSLSIKWAGTGGQIVLNAGGTVSWTNYLSTAECDQIGVLVDATGLAGNNTVHLVIYWMTANEAGEPSANPQGTNGYFTESVEVPDAAVSEANLAMGTFQRYQLYGKEWLIPGTVTRSIWIPTAAAYFQLGMWVDNYPGGSSTACITYLQLAALGSPAGM